MTWKLLTLGHDWFLKVVEVLVMVLAVSAMLWWNSDLLTLVCLHVYVAGTCATVLYAQKMRCQAQAAGFTAVAIEQAILIQQLITGMILGAVVATFTVAHGGLQHPNDDRFDLLLTAFGSSPVALATLFVMFVAASVTVIPLPSPSRLTLLRNWAQWHNMSSLLRFCLILLAPFLTHKVEVPAIIWLLSFLLVIVFHIAWNLVCSNRQGVRKVAHV